MSTRIEFGPEHGVTVQGDYKKVSDELKSTMGGWVEFLTAPPEDSEIQPEPYLVQISRICAVKPVRAPNRQVPQNQHEGKGIGVGA